MSVTKFVFFFRRSARNACQSPPHDLVASRAVDLVLQSFLFRHHTLQFARLEGHSDVIKSPLLHFRLRLNRPCSHVRNEQNLVVAQ